MVKIIATILLALATSDLIGFNRLGNNVFGHQRRRNNARNNGRLSRMILLKYGDISALRKAKSAKNNKFTGKINRRNMYMRNMLRQ